MKTNRTYKDMTVKDLIATLLDYPLNSPVNVFIQGEKSQLVGWYLDIEMIDDTLWISGKS